jgi:hypothetical protein
MKFFGKFFLYITIKNVIYEYIYKKNFFYYINIFEWWIIGEREKKYFF